MMILVNADRTGVRQNTVKLQIAVHRDLLAGTVHQLSTGSDRQADTGNIRERNGSDIVRHDTARSKDVQPSCSKGSTSQRLG